MNKRLTFALLMMSAIGLLPNAALADASRYCPSGGPIRFAHYEFGLIYNQETGKGVDDDIQKELARRTGCRFAVSVQPRARSWTDLESGALDMLGSGVQNPQRDRFAWYAHYVVEINKVLLADAVPESIQSLAEFEARPDLRLGTVRGFSFSPLYDAAIARLLASNRLDQAADTETVFRMFAGGRFQAFISSQFVYGHYLKRFGMATPRRIADWDPEAGTPSGLALSKKRFSAEQASAWQGLMNSMLADGTVRRILERHLGPAEAEASIYRPPQPPRP